MWEKLEPNSDPDSRQPLHGANITTKPFEQVDHPNVGLIRDIIVAAKEGLSNITVRDIVHLTNSYHDRIMNILLKCLQ